MHRRIARIALFAFGLLATLPAAQAFPIQFGVSPDNTQSLLIGAIDSAEKEILLNVYQLDNPAITQAITKKIGEGVTVQILLEGQPLPKISEAGLKTAGVIVKAMKSSKNKKNRFFLMTSDASSVERGRELSNGRRYRYDHAKYVVIDEQRVLVTSENFTTTGHPQPGTVGNRGWETVIDEPSLAGQFVSMFSDDTALKYGDVEDLTHSRNSETGTKDAESGKARHLSPIQPGQGEATDVTLVTSPDSEAGIVKFIRSAKHSLEIEQMSLPLVWKNPKGPQQNPFVAEAIAAAERGAKVRVLLNDDTVFGGSDPSTDSTDQKQSNLQTVKYLRQIARCEKLDLDARIVSIDNVQITYIHNKGMIADGKRVFVSSINGTRNAVMNNREVAVDLESTDAAQYFESVFDFDWTHSPKNPSLESTSTVEEQRACGHLF